jgi:AraC family transcriptional regulator
MKEIAMSGNIRKSDNTIDPQNQMSGGSNHLGLLTSKRVSVLREGQVVPLLPGRPVMDSTQSPWNGLYLEKFDLDALHVSEHEHGTYFLRMHSSKRVEMDWKSSGRNGHTAVDEGSLLFLTPGTYDSLNWHGPAQPIVV